MDASMRAHLAKLVIYIFLGVTALLVLSAAAGLSQWNIVKEILQAWSATYSMLVGAVIAYYFGVLNAQATPQPSLDKDPG
jgi:hypothetical protein